MEQKPKSQKQKTLVSVLASHDSKRPNERLTSLFTHFYNHPDRKRLLPFQFAFTGGTYNRVFLGSTDLGLPPLQSDVADWLHNECGVTRLPSTYEGGVIVLSYLISQRECSIVWPFYAPNANHWQRNENLAFMRLCDQWHVKRLMNSGSVLAWFDHEAELDAKRNLYSCPPKLRLERGDGRWVTVKLPRVPARKALAHPGGTAHFRARAKGFNKMTVALIAHDEMKSRMIEFAVDHEYELNRFQTILATGTTGREVAAATSRLYKKMVRHHSGPKGGDIEIATAILYGFCDVVIFFVDPLKPHPHIEDIRVVFQACMLSDQVVMITNEVHAREFMTRVVRGNDVLTLYYPDKIKQPAMA